MTAEASMNESAIDYTPRQGQFIAAARKLYRELLAGEGDPLHAVPAIRQQLARAGAEADVLDELGNRTTAQVADELRDHVVRAEQAEARCWQDYERDRTAGIGVREQTLRSRRDRLQRILASREQAEHPSVERVRSHVERVRDELIELHHAHGTLLPKR